MKTIKIFIIVLWVFTQSLICLAQNQEHPYIPLLDDSKTWINLNYSSADIYMEDPSTMVFKLLGDTLIDSNIYFKVLSSNDIYQEDFNPEDFVVREDDKKVYSRRIDRDEDCLVYDFNLIVGDAIYFDYDYLNCLTYTGDESLIVTNVDTILFANMQRKRIEFENGLDFWIEGIGSLRGMFLNNVYLIGSTNFLLCYYENDELLYSNPSFGYCSLADLTETFVQKLNTYPNPATNEIFIDNFSDLKNFEYSILNQAGQTLSKGKILSNKIDISNLASGVYYLKIEGKVYKICKI